jgi:biotin transport system substrate-specific component
MIPALSLKLVDPSRTFPTLAATLLPANRASGLYGATLAVLGSLVLWASAKVQVPLWPVPISMQTFVVLCLGAALGSRLGTATVLLYLAEGAVGLPVFAGTPEKGLGLAYMAGPTGGYLAGFVVAAFVVGWLAERGFDRSVPKLAAAMTLGHVVILGFGFAWLSQFVGVDKAWALGVVPFALATVIKTALGALALPALWSLVRR